MVARKFVFGGTVQASNGIYIPRRADEELYHACIEGEYAAVLTARQRGKSSLMVNLTYQLRQQGVHVATIDITQIGSVDSPDKWYFTFLEIITDRNNLALNVDLDQWWKSQSRDNISPSRRFSLFLEQVVLKQLTGNIVIFIDEIDKTFTLNFTDDFFTGIRAIYNQRSQYPEFHRLSFVLLGVASPSDLIKTKTITPYNIGRQIELADFALEELSVFQEELVKQTSLSQDVARIVTSAIYYWTSGHPYLTHRLFKEIAIRSTSSVDWNQNTIDALVNELFIKPRTTLDSNISEVKRRLEFQKLAASNAVELYAKILFSPFVSDDQEEFQPKAFLKLAGVVTTLEGKLEVRNRIYDKIVGIEWFRENYERHYNKSVSEIEDKYKPQQLPVASELERFRSIQPDQSGGLDPFTDDDDFRFDDDDFDPETDDDFTDSKKDAGRGDLLSRYRAVVREVTSVPKTPKNESVSSVRGGVNASTGGETDESKLAAMRQRRASLAGGTGGTYRFPYTDLRLRVQAKLVAELDTKTINFARKSEVRTQVEEIFNSILADESMVLSRSERINLFETIIADILGFGPLEVLLADETITSIMVNGPKNVFIEQKGMISHANVTFEDDEHVMRILDRIVAPLGRRIDETMPAVTFRLPDGSSGNAIIRPISLIGPLITIRKFAKKPLRLEDLIRFGSITAEIAEFLRACAIVHMNILIVGGSGSGKQTLLNVLSGFIANNERLISVERVAEFQLYHEHVITLETRPANAEGRGQVTLNDLAVMAIALKPDRIIFSDLEMSNIETYLDAAGRIGASLAILQAEDLDSALNLLEIGVLRTSPNMTVEHVRNWISGTIKLIVVQHKFRDGTRKVKQIVEVTKLANGRYGLETIFEFEQTGIEGGKIIGRMKPTGRRPSFMPLIEAAGIHLPPSVFGVGRSY